jgi:GxxExxY protein
MLTGPHTSVTGVIVRAAHRVHETIGAGMLESAYEACMAHEIRKRGLTVRQQVALPLVYDGIRLDIGYRIDLLVEEAIVVEVKTVEACKPVHIAQVLSYMRAGGFQTGLLLNFRVARMEDGIRRFSNA